MMFDQMSRYKMYNVIPQCDRMFRIQDKGSRLVLEWKDKYQEKMLSYIVDIAYSKKKQKIPVKEIKLE